MVTGPILYSTNPWYATEIAAKYRNGRYFAWVSEYFDSSTAPGGSAASLIAPSSDPSQIYNRLRQDCSKEDEHSDLIKGYRKTFSRLAKAWAADGSITDDQRDEIIATVKSRSWRIWRPVLYVIPRVNIEGTGRLRSVKRPDRASYGPELQVVDLERHEFDIIELTL
jgi:hypothetical protein